jgi:hypothetical protein
LLLFLFLHLPAPADIPALAPVPAAAHGFAPATAPVPAPVSDRFPARVPAPASGIVQTPAPSFTHTPALTPSLVPTSATASPLVLSLFLLHNFSTFLRRKLLILFLHLLMFLLTHCISVITHALVIELCLPLATDPAHATAIAPANP